MLDSFAGSLRTLLLLVFSPLAVLAAVSTVLLPHESFALPAGAAMDGDGAGERARHGPPQPAGRSPRPAAAGPAVRFLRADGRGQLEQRVDLGWTAGETKARLFPAELEASRRVTFVFRGRRLEDGQTLGEAGVTAGAAVHVAVSAGPAAAGEPSAAAVLAADLACHRTALVSVCGGALTLMWGAAVLAPKLVTRGTLVSMTGLTALFVAAVRPHEALLRLVGGAPRVARPLAAPARRPHAE